MAQYSSFNSFVCFTFASTLLIALESAILYKLVPMVFREKKLRVSMSGLNRPRHCHFFCQLCWFHLRFTLLNHMSIFLLVAGILQIIIGFIVYRIFYPIRIPLEQRQIAKKTTMTSAYRLIFADRGVRHFFSHPIFIFLLFLRQRFRWP